MQPSLMNQLIEKIIDFSNESDLQHSKSKKSMRSDYSENPDVIAASQINQPKSKPMIGPVIASRFLHTPTG